MTLAVSEIGQQAKLRPKAARSRRALDLALITLSAPLWAPTLGLIAAGIAVSSGSPILFKQVRTGQDGVPFTMLKFRSMTTGPNPLIPSPDSITKFGHVLRKTSLDELPQLINVLRGNMSLVGPRPMLPTQAAKLTPEQKARQAALPGMTGLAQVNGRNTISWSERIELDQQWIDQPTVRSYLHILAKTFAVVTNAAGTTGHSGSDPFVEVVEQRAAS